MCVLTKYRRYLHPTYVNNLILKKKKKHPHIPFWLWQNGSALTDIFGLLTGLVFCQTIQLHQLTLSLHSSCIQCTGGQEHTAERGEGAGLPLLAAAHQSIASAARRACPPASTIFWWALWLVRVWKSYQKWVLFSESSIPTYVEFSFCTDVTVAQQTDGTRNERVFSPIFALQFTNSLKTQSMPTTYSGRRISYCDVSIFFFFISSSSIPILNAVKLVFYHKRIKTTPEHQPNRSFTTDRSAPEGRIRWLFYPALPNPWAWF